jgi:phospholipid/cholesterol/gamma-HCH transport system ATP-binding protein
MERGPVIGLVDVTCTFGGQKALDGLGMHVPRGSLFGLVGPGGCGKSTLCKVVCGLVRPDSGVVVVGGVDLAKADRRALQAVQSRCGVQFQNDALFEHMTVLDNVSYPLRRLTDLPPAEIEGRARTRLAMVGLAGFEDRLPNRLSGGQRRRVALARACVTDPEILICDDPTAGLDPVTSRRILDMIAGIRYESKNTVVLASSDVLGLMSVVNRAALVWEGRVIHEGTPPTFWRGELPEVRRFLDDARLPFGGSPWD